MHLYTTSNPIPRNKRNNGKMEGIFYIIALLTVVTVLIVAGLHANKTNQAIRSLRKEIRQVEIRQEELQMTLLNRENKLEELMDGGNISRLATPLGLRHPPHTQRVIPLKVCRTQEGRIIPVTVGSKR